MQSTDSTESSALKWRALGLYAALAVLPPMIFTLLPVGSQAPGIAMAVFAVMLLLQGAGLQPWTRGQLVLPIASGLALVVHLIVVSQWRPVDVSRAGGSLVLLLAVLLVANRASRPLFGAITPKILSWVFVFFVGLGGLSAAGLRLATANATSKPVFPFSEASHFGLALCPIVLSLCILCPRPSMRLAFLGAAAALALSLQNFTLLVGVVLMSAVCLPWRWLLPVAFGGIVAVGLALSSGAESLLYYTERLDFTGESENLTALVVIQGWQMVAEAWGATSGWGLGMQQLGVQGPTADVSDLIVVLSGGDYLNLLDGGFLFAKLAGEFGVFGAGLAAAFAGVAIRSAIELRRMAMAPTRLDAAGAVFARSVLVMYMLELFVRSPGYLTGAAALTFSALWFVVAYTRPCVKARPSRASLAESNP